MSKFVINGQYSRLDVWKAFFPDDPYPGGGNWTTGYVRVDSCLVVFANIGTPGRTGHDFPNKFDPDTGQMTWYGKPNAHSGQETFRDIFRGALNLEIFVRWNSSKPRFLYLGSPAVEKYADNVELPGEISTIELSLSFTNKADIGEDSGPDGSLVDDQAAGLEGKRISVVVNKFERDPRLRMACLEHFGPKCQICDFDFELFYGPIGKDYCHIHHIKPLSEISEEHTVNPWNDLLPVCPNCHAMLHRTTPAMLPADLRHLLDKHNR